MNAVRKCIATTRLCQPLMESQYPDLSNILIAQFRASVAVFD